MNTLTIPSPLKTRSELAHELGISISTLKRRINRAALDIPPYELLGPEHQAAIKRVVLNSNNFNKE